MVKQAKLFKQKLDERKPHIRWNYEVSPDMHEAVRYHFVVVEDRIERDSLCDNFARNLNSGGETIELVRDIDIEVADSRYNARFVSYDTRASPNLLGLNSLNVPITLRDMNLVERVKKGSSVEDYVANLYGR